MKTNNPLRQYVMLRDSLRRRREELRAELADIEAALGESENAISRSGSTEAEATPRAARSAAAPAASNGRRGRHGNQQSLRSLVLEVTSNRALTKDEILEEVKRRGYQFTSSNPANSLGVILYGKNPKFINEGGRFRAPGGAQRGGGSTSKAASSQGGSGSRKMSPEARARIRAAALARWKKAKSEGRSRL